jgi:hypothetical protein
MPMRKKSRQRAYLLRCWQEGEAIPGKDTHWCFSVEEILRKRPRRGFGSLEALLAYLRAELTGGEGEPGKRGLCKARAPHPGEGDPA